MLSKMKFTFKSYQDGKKSSQDASANLQDSKQKRREQVRRAQKTHRERKEAYTKSLEDEVVQLRANESKILLELNALYAKVSTLEKTLNDYGIPLPIYAASAESSTGSVSPLPTVALNIRGIKSKNRQQQICIETPWMQQTQRPGAQKNQPDAGPALPSSSQSPENPVAPDSRKSRVIYDQTANRPPALQTPPISDASDFPISPRSPTTIGELDANVLCMDFVLTLESPCLPHVNVEHQHGSPPTGHALMLSATFLRQRPFESHQQLIAPSQYQDSQQGWQVSPSGIERLLELSRSLPLDAEVTPVQAWDYIRRDPQHLTLNIERYTTLKEKLLKHVKCHGFGGVIEQGIFENIVFEAFIVGRVF